MNFKLKMAGAAVGVAGIVALTSAISTVNVPLEVGNQAPEFSVENSNGFTASLSEMKGQEVILNFWSIKDADSRIRNVRLARESERNGAGYISICIDSDQDIAKEVMEADGLAMENQFFANRSIMKEYLQKEGIQTVKIDPYGIVAKID
ncbi:MAG: redoxin domain-containing protein [Bacteroidales bacterium]|nr:redoxin domain-containing protein [Bacteroidales bacterium]